MIHYTCDRCKRQIDTDEQNRYVVQIDIRSSIDAPCTAYDEDIDQLTELHQQLEGLGGALLANNDDDDIQRNHHGQYDLCADCHRQLLQNPLGKDAMLALGFSNN